MFQWDALGSDLFALVLLIWWYSLERSLAMTTVLITCFVFEWSGFATATKSILTQDAKTMVEMFRKLMLHSFINLFEMPRGLYGCTLLS